MPPTPQQKIYQNFDLIISPVAGDPATGKGARYSVRVIGSPVGEHPPIVIDLPFAGDELRRFFGLRGRTRGLRLVEDPEPSGPPLDPQSFGERLYAAVFTGGVDGLLKRSLDEGQRTGQGLRIRLRLDAPELADLPWEYLYVPDRAHFLANSTETAILRYIELDRAAEPLRVAQLPLNILAVIANPGGDFAHLEVEKEWENLQSALAELQARNRIQLERLDSPTLPALQARLRQGDVHILHFIGHGYFNIDSNQGGLVLLKQDSGAADLVEAATLGTILADHAALRLIFLNACESARGGRNDPFGGVAQRLVQQGILAVLAMQFEVTDPAAITLAREFYAAVAGGYGVEAAVAEARKAVYAGGNTLEWGTLMLFSCSLDVTFFNRLENVRYALESLTAPSPPSEVIRYTDIVCPRRVWIGEPRISVVVRLTMEPNNQSAVLEEVPLSTEFPLLVRVEAPGFEILNEQVQSVVILPESDSGPVVFDLRPRLPGHTQITFDFFQDTQPLRTISVDVEITEHAVGKEEEPLPAQSLQVESNIEPPDMVLHVAWDQVARQFQITLIQKGGAWWRTFASITLNGDPSVYATNLYAEIVTPHPGARHLISVNDTSSISSADAQRRIKKLGQSLWEELIPVEFKRLYAQERERWRDCSCLILSDEPHLPWELIWPYDDENGMWEDEGPWCHSLQLTRWLRKDERGNGNEMAPMWLDIGALAVFVPVYSRLGDLPFARQEEGALVELIELYQLRRSGPTVPTWQNVVDFLESGDYHWIHFAAHGSFFPGSVDGDSTLWLQEDHALSTHDLAGASIRRHFRQQQPAFFFNACEVGRQSYALTRISGWANRLVSAGAGLFIGPLWAVQDSSAAAFAGVFYQALLSGQTVAAATREARRATQQPGDPTWLAYSIYAHPNARVRMPPARSPQESEL